MARAEGLEPPTFWFVARRSNPTELRAHASKHSRGARAVSSTSRALGASLLIPIRHFRFHSVSFREGMGSCRSVNPNYLPVLSATSATAPAGTRHAMQVPGVARRATRPCCREPRKRVQRPYPAPGGGGSTSAGISRRRNPNANPSPGRCCVPHRTPIGARRAAPPYRRLRAATGGFR